MRMLVLFLLVLASATAQKRPEDFGWRQIDIPYKNSVAKVIVRSKTGEESKPKPIFFWCQGSMPQPLIKYEDDGVYGILPFNEKDFLDDYHIVIVSKPGVPVAAHTSTLSKSLSYLENGNFTKEYAENNHLAYYVERNNFIIKKLLKETWALKSGLVAAGHSEGTYIAAKMAATNKKVTKLIYSGGNPYGRILSILSQDRYKNTDTTTIDYWKSVIADKDNIITQGNSDSNKTTYSFSVPIAEDILKLKIPVLISYGTKDWSTPYNDLLQTEAIRRGNKNITFLAYHNTEHNYFPVDDKMQPDHNVYNWEKVGADWAKWLKQ